MEARQQRKFWLVLVVLLAVLQGALALVRAFGWFQMGADLAGQGLLFIPLMGFIAVARGGLVAMVALLYFLFAAGEMLGKSWAWWCGLIAALINVLLVLNLFMQGDAALHYVLWVVVPVVLIYYLFTARRI